MTPGYARPLGCQIGIRSRGSEISKYEKSKRQLIATPQAEKT